MSPVPTNKSIVLSVRLESEDGAEWTAIGGGKTVEETVEFALASAPAGVRWRVVGWSDVFGE
jgi:hypothetical protein